MTDEGKRYVELAAELERLDGTSQRYAEVAGEMDRLWWQLSEPEHDEINELLIALDDVARNAKGYPPAESDG